MQKSHIIVFDSKHRLNYNLTEANDCQVRFEPAIGGFNKVELLNFSVPIIQYNIDSSNNLVYFNDGSSDWVATLSSGAYTYITLPIELKRAMDDVSSQSFDVSYSEITFKLSVTVTSVASFKFTFSNTSNSAARILGFQNSDTSLAATHTSFFSLNLSLPMYFFVQIPELGTHVKSSSQNDWGTFVLTTSGNSGDILTFNMFSGYQLLESFQHSSLSSVNIRLVNSGGELLDLRGLDWIMVLKLHYPQSQFI